MGTEEYDRIIEEATVVGDSVFSSWASSFLIRLSPGTQVLKSYPYKE